MRNSIKREQSQIDLNAAEREIFGRRVTKKIEIPEEALERLKAGRYVEGSLGVDKLTNRLIFRAFHRQPRKKRKRDRVICYHNNGWLKQSENNLKFFASVPKRVGAVCACQTMDDDLQYVTEVLFDKLENEEISDDDLTMY